MSFLEKLNADANIGGSVNFIGEGEQVLSLVTLKEEVKKGTNIVRYLAQFLVLEGAQKGKFVNHYYMVNDPNWNFGPQAQRRLLQTVGALHNTDDLEKARSLDPNDLFTKPEQPGRGLICRVVGVKSMAKDGSVKRDKKGDAYVDHTFLPYGTDLTPENIASNRKTIEAHEDFKGSALPSLPSVGKQDALLTSLGI